MPRQTKLTEALIAEIATHIEHGNSKITAIRRCGISEAIFYRWQQQAREQWKGRGRRPRSLALKIRLIEAIEAAEAEFHGTVETNLVTFMLKDAATARFVAIKRLPKIYGEQPKDQEGDVPIKAAVFTPPWLKDEPTAPATEPELPAASPDQKDPA